MREIEPIYISLQEATRYCNYSQEYLSLRARQKKLKAVKFGRNWLTKKEWLENYLRKVEAYKNKKIALPPENLPIAPTPIPKIYKFQWKTLIFIGVGVILLVVGITFGKDSFKYTFEAVLRNLSFLVVEFNENIEKTFPETVFLAGVNARDIFKITVETFEEFSQWFVSLLLHFTPK